MNKRILFLLLFGGLGLCLQAQTPPAPCCDCNGDGVQTEAECEADTNADGIMDACLTLSITAADLTTDSITVQLGPANATATLTLIGITSGGDVSIASTTATASATSSPQNITGWRSILASGGAMAYTGFKVTWGNYASATTTYAFENLGFYRNSQYNIPNESHSTCGGSGTSVHLTNSSCTFSTGSLSSTFLSQTLLNGSGVSASYGNISREWYCVVNPRPHPSGSNSSNTFRTGVTFSTGCSNTNLSATTVAIKPSHPKLTCGDRVYIMDFGTKTVTDRGGGLAEAQLDNFTTDGKCTGITDLGDRWVFKIPATP